MPTVTRHRTTSTETYSVPLAEFLGWLGIGQEGVEDIQAHISHPIGDNQPPAAVISISRHTEP